jgi:hypothetical protein
MPALPWTSGPAAIEAPRSGAPSTETPGTEHGPALAIVFASRLRLRRWRDVPAFLRWSMQVRAAASSSAGCLGVTLDAHVLGRTFFTLSTWVDDDALAMFVRTDVHSAAMRRWASALSEARFERWLGDPRPSWRDARGRLTTQASSSV